MTLPLSSLASDKVMQLRGVLSCPHVLLRRISLFVLCCERETGWPSWMQSLEENNKKFAEKILDFGKQNRHESCLTKV